MAHGEVMRILASKGGKVSKEMGKALKNDMKVDKKESKNAVKAAKK